MMEIIKRPFLSFITVGDGWYIYKEVKAFENSVQSRITSSTIENGGEFGKLKIEFLIILRMRLTC